MIGVNEMANQNGQSNEAKSLVNDPDRFVEDLIICVDSLPFKSKSVALNQLSAVQLSCILDWLFT